MLKENLTKFELNNDSLEDFDSLMSKHLDNVEELIVHGIETKSKLLNVVGLCINISTLIIEGDERTNVNNIISNLSKPELIKNLILNGVKIPSSASFKKLTSLKMLSLNNIRACSAKSAVDEIINPEKIEAFNFDNVDFAKSSIDCIRNFINLKYLNLINVKNCRLDNLVFLQKMTKLEKINIENNVIGFSQLKYLTNCKFNRQVKLYLPTEKGQSFFNTIEIQDDGIICININDNKLADLVKNVDLANVTNINVIISSSNNISNYISIFKKIKGNFSITIKDFSCLSSNDAMALKEELKVEDINIMDFDKTALYENNCYYLETKNYIKIRDELDKILEQVSLDSDDELLKFLQLYKFLCENISYDLVLEEDSLDYSRKKRAKSSYFQSGILDKQTIDIGYAEILKNALKCIGIESKIIIGTYADSKDEHVWNQVKILDKWYNVDLGLDSKKINNSNKRRIKPAYCLISDNLFSKTHNVLSSNGEVCHESIDRKVISAFFKSSNNFKEQINIIINKIKELFKFNKFLALPEGRGKHEKI